MPKNKSKNKILFIFLLSIVIIFIFIIVVEFICFFYIYPNHKIEDIIVNVPTASTITAEEIVKLSKIDKDEYFFNLDKETIKNNILSNGRIKDVQITKNFLSGNVTISYIERLPISVMIKNTKTFSILFAIDEDGVIFQIGNGDDYYDLPVISGINLDNKKINDVLSDEVVKIQKDLLKLRVEQRELFDMISEIKFVENKEVISEILLWLRGYSIPVKLGLVVNADIIKSVAYALSGIKKTGEIKDTVLYFDQDKVLLKKRQGV